MVQTNQVVKTSVRDSPMAGSRRAAPDRRRLRRSSAREHGGSLLRVPGQAPQCIGPLLVAEPFDHVYRGEGSDGLITALPASALGGPSRPDPGR
jgi:hypothetical protein